ncbi:MAG: hypothetical protein AAGA48_18640 [Myxococcota bacterium]
MTDWWQQLEGQGRAGGWLGLLASLTMIGGALAIGIYPMYVEWGRWESAGFQFIAGLLFVMGLPALFYSARLLTAPVYPSASSVFPSLSTEELTAVIHDRTDDICVCTRCRIVVPALYSTGSCPVCSSSIDYQDVRDDEDVKLVLAAL